MTYDEAVRVALRLLVAIGVIAAAFCVVTAIGGWWQSRRRE